MNFANPNYDKRKMWRLGAWLLVLLVMCKFTGGIAYAVMIPFMLAAAMRRKGSQLFFILMLSCEALVVSSFFIPKTFSFYMCQRAVTLGTAGLLILQLFGHRHPKIVTPLLGIVPYLIYMAMVSQTGWCPVISNLKLLLFVLTFFALYGSAVESMVDAADARETRGYILCLCVFFVVGSVLVIPIPSISYMASAEELERMAHGESFVSLFKGVTSHSQTFGPMIALFATLIYADLTFSVQRKDKLYFLMLLLCPLLIIKTSSRTAMGTLIAGMGFVTWLAMTARGGKRTWRRKTVSTMTMLAVVGAIAFIAVPQLRDHLAHFIVKYGRKDEEVEINAETVFSSRRSKYEGSMENWDDKPLTGNGFQVSEEMKGKQIHGIRDMLSAPVEKCTWVLAVLEEGGVIGLVLFCVFWITALIQMVKRGAYIGGSVFFAMIVSNLGEFTIFSMSAMGGAIWALVFAGLVLDAKQTKSGERRNLFARVARGPGWR